MASVNAVVEAAPASPTTSRVSVPCSSVQSSAF